MYAFSNNGQVFRAWDDLHDLAAGEIFFDHYPDEAELRNAFPDRVAVIDKEQINTPLLEQIIALEATMTPRRLREAMLGVDNGWLISLNSQITTLRQGLQP